LRGNPTSTSKSRLRHISESKFKESMSHLLCLNSCDNYPNKCPHICLHLSVKQRPQRQAVRPLGGVPPEPRSALYAWRGTLQGPSRKKFREFRGWDYRPALAQTSAQISNSNTWPTERLPIPPRSARAPADNTIARPSVAASKPGVGDDASA
jgi:hypothetical protein